MNLVETVIAFRDASTGELWLNERRCTVDELISDVADLQLPGADGVLKSISVDRTSLQTPLYVDPDQIKLTLNALALNAINHGGQEITPGSGQDAQGNVELWISGSGRADHVELARLYEPFVVGGDVDARDTRGGLGPGLPLTRKLVELHGGDFEVRSEPDSTTAVIRLPVWRNEMA